MKCWESMIRFLSASLLIADVVLTCLLTKFFYDEGNKYLFLNRILGFDYYFWLLFGFLLLPVLIGVLNAIE